MISFFGGKKKNNKVENKTFHDFLAPFSFKGLFSKSSLQRNTPINLHSVLYMKGEEHILLLQNPVVTGHDDRMAISRKEGQISEDLSGEFRFEI